MNRPTKLERLRTLRSQAALARADFSQLHPRPADRLPTCEAEVTPFIKKRTKLYLETWVLSIIDELIAEEERRIIKARTKRKGG